MSSEEGFDEVVYDTSSRVEAPSRACDACRKMKIKCVGKDHPPCKRCKNMRIPCRFAMGPVPRGMIEETEATKSRIEQLEGHVSGIYKKLDEMTSVLSRIAGGPASTTPTAGPSEMVSPRVQSSHSNHNNHTHNHRSNSLSQHTPTAPSHGVFRPAPPPSLPSTGSVMSLAVLPEPPEVKALEPSASRSSSPLSADDMLESAMEGEPFRHFTRREEELHFIEQHGALPAGGAPRAKKRKTADTGEAAEWEHSPIHERGDPLRHTFVDPVSSGLVGEGEARALFVRFYKYAHPFIPVFDPERDTYDSLLRRSPFCLTVIIMVALHHGESLSGVKSDVCQRIRAEAEKMVKETLFSPAATLETVQGLVAMVSYSEHAWRTCCHVMSLAVDMRLYRCLPYLHKIRKDSRHPDRLLERQRPLVVGARTWLAIVRLSYEMSFNHSLPIQFGSPQRLQYARELIDHPYSTPLDSRLVIACEMCEQREIAFRPWESIATLHPSEIDAGIRRANTGIKELYAHWLAYYDEQGLERDHFLMIELENQRAYCLMYANSSAWYGVLKRDDVFRLSPERREWIQEAMRSGAFLVASLAHQRLEKESEFGNHNYYVGIVATARYLIRMAELLPSACDLHEVSLNIDRLLLKLPVYPVKPFSDGLRRTLRKAREQGVLPSTRMTTDSSPMDDPQSLAATLAAHTEYPGFNPFPWHDPVQTAGQIGGAGVPQAGNVSWPDELNLAAWFPANEDPAAMGLDVSALQGEEMANWFPAAPQVWLEE